jgi:pre-rRNA-processing protein TSR1
LLSFIKYFVPSQSKVLDLELSSDSINAARAVCEGRPSAVKWKDGRSWMVGEDVQWEENIINEGSDRMGTLMVTGTVRGAPLSANRLVHIPNFGDFQISKASIRAKFAHFLSLTVQHHNRL